MKKLYWRYFYAINYQLRFAICLPVPTVPSLPACLANSTSGILAAGKGFCFLVSLSPLSPPPRFPQSSLPPAHQSAAFSSSGVNWPLGTRKQMYSVNCTVYTQLGLFPHGLGPHFFVWVLVILYLLSSNLSPCLPPLCYSWFLFYVLSDSLSPFSSLVVLVLSPLW